MTYVIRIFVHGVGVLVGQSRACSETLTASLYRNGCIPVVFRLATSLYVINK